MNGYDIELKTTASEEHLLYDSISIKFKIRQNSSRVVYIGLVVTLPGEKVIT